MLSLSSRYIDLLEQFHTSPTEALDYQIYNLVSASILAYFPLVRRFDIDSNRPRNMTLLESKIYDLWINLTSDEPMDGFWELELEMYAPAFRDAIRLWHTYPLHQHDQSYSPYAHAFINYTLLHPDPLEQRVSEVD